MVGMVPNGGSSLWGPLTGRWASQAICIAPGGAEPLAGLGPADGQG